METRTDSIALGVPDGVAPMNVSGVRVRMYHTDFVGGAFHDRCFDLFEEARTEAFRRAGFHWEQTHREGAAFVVTAIGAEFFRPTAMDDELAIGVFVTRLSKARGVVEYEVCRAGEPDLLARGHTDCAVNIYAPQPPGGRAGVHARGGAALQGHVPTRGIRQQTSGISNIAAHCTLLTRTGELQGER